jgi:hypothetical protein
MIIGQIEKILILAKTYPSPSSQYVETSCVAGITSKGKAVRLFPIPFRMVNDKQQFKKWQWVNVRIVKAPKDHRPESHRVYVDTIECGDLIGSGNAWRDRWEWIDKLPSFDSLQAINEANDIDRMSLALLRPKKVVGLKIVKAKDQDWTDEERNKLLREQMQGSLFSELEEKKTIKELRKIPFDFYYVYLCNTPEGEREYKSKIIDWEAGALYWNCRKYHGEDWEKPFRAKLETELPSKELLFLMGNQHRFQDQWLIISLIYPPRRMRDEGPQLQLL